ncbi:hypothetical protein CPC08DRAFT_767507 [Agrocybe pediades]|nr:hypothetical protein CPC08DRAFT_767507 [Agrocybe pediades]
MQINDDLLIFKKELEGEPCSIPLDWPVDTYWQGEEEDSDLPLDAEPARWEYEDPQPEPWWVWDADSPPPDVLAWYYERTGMAPPSSPSSPPASAVRPPSTPTFLFSRPEVATRFTRTLSERPSGSAAAVRSSGGRGAAAGPSSLPHQHTYTPQPPQLHAYPPPLPPSVQQATAPQQATAHPQPPPPLLHPQPQVLTHPTFKVGEPWTLAPELEGGWKHPAGVTSAHLVLHTAAESRAIQVATDGPKLLVQILGANPRSRLAPLAMKIAKVLSSHPENQIERPALGFPDFRGGWKRSPKPLFTGLLTNITPRFRQMLLTQVCVSVSEFTAFFYPAEDNSVVSDFAFEMKAVTHVLDSIHAIPQLCALQGGEDSATLFNIHITPPTTTTLGLKDWLEYLRGKKYQHMSFNFGCGSAKVSLMCAKCGGHDHPVGNYPIPILVGRTPDPGTSATSALFLLDAKYQPAKRTYPNYGHNGPQQTGGQYRPKRRY